MIVAGDRLDDAVAAAREVAGRLGIQDAQPEVLYSSNNVVVRLGEAVLKVAFRGSTMLEREAEVAAEGHALGAPVLCPLSEVMSAGDFLVGAWPYIRQSQRQADEPEVVETLKRFHAAMAGCKTELVTILDSLEDTRRLAGDPSALAAISHDDRSALVRAIDAGIVAMADRPFVVIHGEPRRANWLVTEDRVILIDLEGTKLAPVEYDLAFFPEATVSLYWPDHDAALLEAIRHLQDAKAATYCWRHVTARPDDRDMRRHGEHSLGLVRKHEQQLERYTPEAPT